MNDAPEKQLSSDELKEQRRRNASRWAERPTCSLWTVMIGVAAIALWLSIYRISNFASLVGGPAAFVGLFIACFWFLCSLGYKMT